MKTAIIIETRCSERENICHYQDASIPFCLYKIDGKCTNEDAINDKLNELRNKMNALAQNIEWL
jgi:hypothetical protein